MAIHLHISFLSAVIGLCITNSSHEAKQSAVLHMCYIFYRKSSSRNVQRNGELQLVHHDSASVLTKLSGSLVAKTKWLWSSTPTPHPYSPDLAPCDFLFPKMIWMLKGERFNGVLETNIVFSRYLMVLQKNCFRHAVMAESLGLVY